MSATGPAGAVGAPYDIADNPFKGRSQPPPSPEPKRTEVVKKSPLPLENTND